MSRRSSLLKDAILYAFDHDLSMLISLHKKVSEFLSSIFTSTLSSSLISCHIQSNTAIALCCVPFSGCNSPLSSGLLIASSVSLLLMMQFEAHRIWFVRKNVKEHAMQWKTWEGNKIWKIVCTHKPIMRDTLSKLNKPNDAHAFSDLCCG